MQFKAQKLTPLPASPAVRPGPDGEAYPAVFNRLGSSQTSQVTGVRLPPHPDIISCSSSLVDADCLSRARRGDICTLRDITTPSVNEGFGLSQHTERKPATQHLFCAESLACMTSSNLHNSPMRKILSPLCSK